jgi:glycosyltransferase involved in cell wall biosynthesis
MSLYKFKKMNILYVSQYFPPDKGAAQARAKEMVKSLVDSGHEVTVLTEFPNYPSGIVLSRYKFKLFEKDTYHGAKVTRVFVRSSPKMNFANRMLFYLSFMISSIIGAMKLKDKYDLVYVTSPPLFVGLSGFIISRLKKARFVFEVRDLWPESAIALGALKNKTIVRLSHRLADFCYHKANKIIAATRGIGDHLERRGLDRTKLCIIQNGVDLKMFNDLQRNLLSRERLGYQDKFVVLYAGLLGLAQGVESMAEVVKLLSNEKHVNFLFIGNGPLKWKLLQMQEANRLENIKIMDEMTRKEVIEYITIANCCMVPLRKADIFRTALPTKMLEAWSCRKPVVLSVDGEAREHLEKAKAGLWAEPENPHEIAKAIKYLFDNPQLCRKYGHNGRRYVEKHFSRKVQAERLEKKLLEVLSHP